MKIIRNLLRNTNFLIGSSLTLLYYSRHLKYEINKIAETETVCNALHYVIVRAARGEYTRFGDGDMIDRVDAYFTNIEQIAVDYKFFNQIKRRDNDVKIIRPRKPVDLIKHSKTTE